ncbi:hybrid sensor histidine kinase/response regulator [Fluoribacter gormanii]|uniref:histidine kinase n=1 Tax=Fluoribacter gormanii TaxID=464 RepID=A0A377GMS3_9GAMM|nr:hybrid sensor histidine kinase/response regulator [Fluoribacter gormanii]KTD02460.1 sensor histidine kinase [Fluoribacter gormanii]MCW8445495.1 hybrid sensor histidine kinase/response regulator [Fluoribacter gormanii]MCW8470745.1 hybrid sensor histidine kinase/response regulator [Fluoribacter gormanii]SIR92891.1 two-component system, chemotaxis family, CheB/CheR fusion protein [Fluoribacter gormanii]STO26137.1 Phytochrome-like protein cph1 [Fluoribacter gormanii]
MQNAKLPSNIKECSAWYVSAMEHLVEVVQDLSQANDIHAITEIVRRAARELTGADGATFVLREGNCCYYVEENAIAPLWKGKRFPMQTCISGWVMLNKKSAVIEDIYRDPRIPQDAYRPTFVKSLAMVPIRREDPIGAIGNYWAKKRLPTQEELNILQALADTTSVALRNAHLYIDLKAHIETIREREAHVRAQRDTLEIFTRALAHDLREPLRTMSSFVDVIIQEEPHFSGRVADYFQHIYNASKRMLTLIDTVFNYMQLDEFKKELKEECDMNEIIAEVLKNLDYLIREKNARIIAETLPHVKANRTQMIQLMQNLISNAIYYNEHIPEISISANPKKQCVEFHVSDNGLGIDSKDNETIFLPFKRATRVSTGSGLGLAICAKILELHGGTIECKSRLGGGTIFSFTLPPALKVNRPRKVKETSVSPVNIPSKTTLANILFVDDLKEDLEFTKIILERAHISFNLFIAQSGKEALNLLHDQFARNNPIDLIFLDINLPGMDGFEILKKIQTDKLLNKIPVIMCTGSDYRKDREKSAALGAAGYLIKPIEKESLQGIIDNLTAVRYCQTDEGYIIVRTKH